jgi:hypothetical protein
MDDFKPIYIAFPVTLLRLHCRGCHMFSELPYRMNAIAWPGLGIRRTHTPHSLSPFHSSSLRLSDSQTLGNTWMTSNQSKLLFLSHSSVSALSRSSHIL